MKSAKQYIDEAQLVARLQARDSSALAYLYDHYSPAILGIVQRIVRNENIAQEVVQDVFIKVWNTIHQYTSTRGRLFTWLFRLTRNLAIDRLRGKELSHHQKTESLNLNNLTAINNNHYSEQQTDNIGIESLLSQLLPEQCLIMKLLYLKGFTHSQVAAANSIPLGTVKTRHRMAMIHLRQLLIAEI